MSRLSLKIKLLCFIVEILTKRFYLPMPTTIATSRNRQKASFSCYSYLITSAYPKIITYCLETKRQKKKMYKNRTVNRWWWIMFGELLRKKCLLNYHSKAMRMCKIRGRQKMRGREYRVKVRLVLGIRGSACSWLRVMKTIVNMKGWCRTISKMDMESSSIRMESTFKAISKMIVLMGREFCIMGPTVPPIQEIGLITNSTAKEFSTMSFL